MRPTLAHPFGRSGDPPIYLLCPGNHRATVTNLGIPQTEGGRPHGRSHTKCCSNGEAFPRR